jgi:hypothetical protein
MVKIKYTSILNKKPPFVKPKTPLEKPMGRKIVV